MEFLLVPGGCYSMGDVYGAGFDDERPVHEVCVSPFYMGKFEVTLDQFRAFAAATGYLTEAERKGGCTGWDGNGFRRSSGLSWKHTAFPQKGNHPVVCVSYQDAEAFAAWMSKGVKRSFRLPTEAEWEYAARGGGKLQPYAWSGKTPGGNVAEESFRKRFPSMETWKGYDDGIAFTAPVGSFPPGPLGLHDLTGNVWEWCRDWYDDEYYGYSPREDPSGPAEGEARSLRGGSWFYGPGTSRNTYRYRLDPSDRFDDAGFRLVFRPRH
jgi:formylglycine-generating enzyme required for sulfatase activity